MTGIGSEIRQACVSSTILHVSGCEREQILKSREGPYWNKVAFPGTVSEEVKFSRERMWTWIIFDTFCTSTVRYNISQIKKAKVNNRVLFARISIQCEYNSYTEVHVDTNMFNIFNNLVYFLPISFRVWFGICRVPRSRCSYASWTILVCYVLPDAYNTRIGQPGKSPLRTYVVYYSAELRFTKKVRRHDKSKRLFGYSKCDVRNIDLTHPKHCWI